MDTDLIKREFLFGLRDRIRSAIEPTASVVQDFHEDQIGAVNLDRRRFMVLAGAATAAGIFAGGHFLEPMDEATLSNRRHSLITLTAIADYNRDNLGDINFPQKIIDNTDPDDIFPKGVGDYESFEKQVTNTLQPKDIACTDVINCKEEKVKNTATILSHCALGKYQILLAFHGHHIDGWKEADPKERLKIIHTFMSTPELQDEVCLKILRILKEQHHGIAINMASEYYSGNGLGLSSIKNAAYGAPSPLKYAGIVGKDYRKRATHKGFLKRDLVQNETDLLVFRDCIGDRESGYYAEK